MIPSEEVMMRGSEVFKGLWDTATNWLKSGAQVMRWKKLLVGADRAVQEVASEDVMTLGPSTQHHATAAKRSRDGEYAIAVH